MRVNWVRLLSAGLLFALAWGFYLLPPPAGVSIDTLLIVKQSYILATIIMCGLSCEFKDK